MKLSTKQKIDRTIGKLLVTVLTIPVRVAGKILQLDHSSERIPETIFIIKILGLGSLISASQSIYAIRMKYPKARLVLIAGRNICEGAKPLNLFDELIVIDDHGMMSLLSSSFFALIKTWRSGKRWSIDLEVFSKLTTVFSLLTFSRNRYGFEMKDVHFRHYLNTHNIFFNQNAASEKSYRRLAEAAGCTEFPTFTPVFEKTLTNEKYILINNSCSALSEERKLAEQDMVKLIRNVLKSHDEDVVLSGTMEDKAANDRVISMTDENRVRNIAGEFDFTSYYSFLQNNVKKVYTIDSAPLHMAVLLNKETVAFFGPTDPIHILPESYKNVQVKYRKMWCSPCVHQTWVLPCKGKRTCMVLIDS